MNPISGFIVISLILVMGYGIGLLNFLNDFVEDKCEMTYMFEYPQFVKISNKADKLFPKYGLYAYSEGRLTARTRSMYFDGIPVLFIPGNAGSYKQVRSLSSVALRIALNSKTPFHFDYYTIDFNDELSGLYGPVLYDQLNYVNSSIYRILELYNERKTKPTSIILVGHSMGGVIARNLLSQISNPHLISVLITQAAPLKRAPILLDYHMHMFYESNAWKASESVDTTIISISGGYSDFLIPSYLTDLQENNSLSVVTTNIPRCWVETNHIQIIWCKQLILAVNRALFDSVDLKTKQISSNSTYRKMVFQHHMTNHSGIKIRNRDNYLEMMKIDYRGQWIENILRQYSVEFLKGLKEPHWHMVRLVNLPAHEMFTEAIHLTQSSRIWPSARYKRRYFEINMNELRKNHSELTHIVFRALPTREPVVFHVDVYDSTERKITVDLPKWWYLSRQIILEKTAEKAVNYELILPQLEHIIQYYHLYLEPKDCATEHNHASASLIVPWSNQNHHKYFTNTEKGPLKVRLYSSRPLNNSHPAIIKLTLEPSCTYQISIQLSVMGRLGQLTRFYTPFLLTNVAVVVLVSLKFQLRSLQKGHCSILFTALKEGAKPYYVLPFVKIFSKIFSEEKLQNFLPKPDNVYLVEEGTDFFLLPFLLFVGSVGIVWLLAVILTISLITLESTVHRAALKLLARTVSFNMVWSDYLMSALHKVPLFVAGVLILLCFSTCGGLALLFGSSILFLEVKKKSESKETVEEKSSEESKVTDEHVEDVKTVLQKDEQDEIHEREEKTDDNKNEHKAITQIGDSDITHTEKLIVDDHKNEDVTRGDNVAKAEENKVNKRKSNSNKETKNENELENFQNNESKEHYENKPKEVNELSHCYNSIFFHTTLFFIWCIIALINVPAVLTWAHNFKFSHTLTPDDSFIPGLALSICALPLWHFDFPKTNRKWLDKLEIFVLIIAIISLIFASISVYRLNYLLSLTIIIITLHQMFAPETPDSRIETDDEDVTKTREKYEDVKTKLD
ncbi:hypothetical protein NQ318_004425 [Aromia moschata]|uniref:GPI inositol-deacylase n=1 Tax=Aromia moschata TaxID=1265417 RepID=A0AAV8Y3Y0_9CUCU|nr:hypothetical protein NQ318_004425 [Aromia moschata]